MSNNPIDVMTVIEDLESKIKRNIEIFNSEFEELQKKSSKNKKRFPKKAKSLEFFENELKLCCEQLLDKQRFPLAAQDPAFQQQVVEKFKLNNSHLNKEQLMKGFALLRIEYFSALTLISQLSKNYHRVYEHLYKTVMHHTENATKRGDSRNSLNDLDNSRLLECLEMFACKLQRPFIESDLREYIRLVKRTYPKQEHIQKPRLTGEEKTYPKTDQEYILKKKIEKRGTSWSEPRIIRFFNTATGLKGTTL